MSSNELLALIGCIIIAGFFGNLLFRISRIPAVVLLMGIGMLVGPVFHLVNGETLFEVAPFFGKVALLIILFSGGLGLNLKLVVEQAGKAALLAFLGFGLSLLFVFLICRYVMEMEVFPSLTLGVLMGGNASAIIIPMLPGLRLREGVRTLLSIESALSYLGILVGVVIVCDLSVSQGSGPLMALLWLLYGIFIALISAIVAGVLWSRIMGAMRNQPLGYMLTLGFIFLLNFLVEEYLGGNGPIAILFFAIVLANMEQVVSLTAPILRRRHIIRLHRSNFMLNDFMKGIAGELSFLVGTFFFVLLGILINFDKISANLLLDTGLMILVLFGARLVLVPLFRRMNKGTTWGESVIHIALAPRGLATAVSAFTPAAAPYFMKGTENFPLFAMAVILGSNLLMTALVGLGGGLQAGAGKSKKGKKREQGPVDVLSGLDVPRPPLEPKQGDQEEL